MARLLEGGMGGLFAAGAADDFFARGVAGKDRIHHAALAEVQVAGAVRALNRGSNSGRRRDRFLLHAQGKHVIGCTGGQKAALDAIDEPAPAVNHKEHSHESK